MRMRVTGVLAGLLLVGAVSTAAAAARAVPLVEAVKRGDAAAVRTLVAQKTNVFSFWLICSMNSFTRCASRSLISMILLKSLSV